MVVIISLARKKEKLLGLENLVCFYDKKYHITVHTAFCILFTTHPLRSQNTYQNPKTLFSQYITSIGKMISKRQTPKFSKTDHYG